MLDWSLVTKLITIFTSTAHSHYRLKARTRLELWWTLWISSAKRVFQIVWIINLFLMITSSGNIYPIICSVCIFVFIQLLQWREWDFKLSMPQSVVWLQCFICVSFCLSICLLFVEFTLSSVRYQNVCSHRYYNYICCYIHDMEEPQHQHHWHTWSRRFHLWGLLPVPSSDWSLHYSCTRVR